MSSTNPPASLAARLAVAAVAAAAVVAGPASAASAPLGSAPVANAGELAARFEAIGGAVTMRVVETVAADAPAFESRAKPFTAEEKRLGYRKVPSGGAAWDSSEGINMVLLEAGKRVHLPRKAVNQLVEDVDARYEHGGDADTTAPAATASPPPALVEAEAEAEAGADAARTPKWYLVDVAKAEAAPRSFVTHLDLRPERHTATGFLVSSRAVATAAHNVANSAGPDGKSEAQKQILSGIKVKPGRARFSGDEGTNGVSKEPHDAMEAIVMQKYLDGNADMDVAVLCLEAGGREPKHGHFRLLENPTAERISAVHSGAHGGSELMTGYPSGHVKSDPGDMWEEVSPPMYTWHGMTDAPYMIGTTLAADQGNSGSPIWFPGKTAGTAYATGVMFKSTFGTRDDYYSYAVNMVPEVADFIKSAIATCDALPATKAEYVKPEVPDKEDEDGQGHGGKPLVSPEQLEKHRREEGGGGDDSDGVDKGTAGKKDDKLPVDLHGDDKGEDDHGRDTDNRGMLLLRRERGDADKEADKEEDDGKQKKKTKKKKRNKSKAARRLPNVRSHGVLNAE